MTTVTIAGTELELPEWRVEHWAQNPTWEEAHLCSMKANLRPGMVVYDIGAELGDFTALFAKWVGTTMTHEHQRDRTGHVVAHVEDPRSLVVPVEPSSWYWPAIRETFEVNGLARPVGSFCGFAASDTAYHESPRRPWPQAAKGTYSERQGFANVLERPDLGRITVDDLARTTRPPAVITMDVEGAEHQVLLGATRVLREYKPLLWLSIHPDCLRRDWAVTVEDVHTLLGTFGYEGVFLGHGHEEWWAYHIPDVHRWVD